MAHNVLKPRVEGLEGLALLAQATQAVPALLALQILPRDLGTV